MASEKTLAIAAAFLKFLQTGDRELIEGYTKTDITAALSEISPADSRHAWYKAMEKRVDQLETLEEREAAHPSVVGRLSYDSIHVFLSHIHDDVAIAKELKSIFEGFGASAFVAHEDIRPSAAWQKVILRHLTVVCNIFVPILTKRFHASEWTDQEVGVAVGRGMVMAPIKVDVDPYGFMEANQAIPLRGSHSATFHFTCVELLSGIASEYPELKGAIKKCIIQSLRASHTFDQAGASSKALLEFVPFMPKEANQIAQSVVENNQVYGSGSAMPHLEEFFKKYGGQVNPELLKKCDTLRVRPTVKA